MEGRARQIPPRVTSHVHLRSRVQVGKLSKFAPHVTLEGDPDVLAFLDEDNESHIFVLNDSGRLDLASKLSGVILA